MLVSLCNFVTITKKPSNLQTYVTIWLYALRQGVSLGLEYGDRSIIGLITQWFPVYQCTESRLPWCYLCMTSGPESQW